MSSTITEAGGVALALGGMGFTTLAQSDLTDPSTWIQFGALGVLSLFIVLHFRSKDEQMTKVAEGLNILAIQVSATTEVLRSIEARQGSVESIQHEGFTQIERSLAQVITLLGKN